MCSGLGTIVQVMTAPSGVAHLIRAARILRPTYRDDFTVTSLRLHQHAGPLPERHAPFLEVIVSIVDALDAAGRMPQAALGHLAPDAECGELGACSAAQVVQRKRAKSVLHAL